MENESENIDNTNIVGQVCSDPIKLLEILERSNSGTGDYIPAQVLEENCFKQGLMFHARISRDSNSFFTAISLQMLRLGMGTQTPQDIRQSVVHFLKSNPTICTGPDGPIDLKAYVADNCDAYCEAMSESAHADAIVVFATARYLQKNIHIISNFPERHGHCNTHLVLGSNSDNATEKAIQIGYEGNWYYRSLQAVPECLLNTNVYRGDGQIDDSSDVEGSVTNWISETEGHLRNREIIEKALALKEVEDLLSQLNRGTDEEKSEKQYILTKTHVNTAQAYLTLKEPNNAITRSATALHLDPNNATALYQIGQAFGQLDQPYLARKFTQHAVDQNSTEPLWKTELGRIEEQIKFTRSNHVNGCSVSLLSQVRKALDPSAENDTDLTHQLQQNCSKIGLKLHRDTSTGNCLLKAVEDQLSILKHPRESEQMKESVIEFFRSRPSLKGDESIDWEAMDDFDYEAMLTDTGKPDGLVVIALAHSLHWPILVVTNTSDKNSMFLRITAQTTDVDKQPLTIGYAGNGQYCSLHRKDHAVAPQVMLFTSDSVWLQWKVVDDYPELLRGFCVQYRAVPEEGDHFDEAVTSESLTSTWQHRTWTSLYPCGKIEMIEDKTESVPGQTYWKGNYWKPYQNEDVMNVCLDGLDCDTNYEFRYVPYYRMPLWMKVSRWGIPSDIVKCRIQSEQFPPNLRVENITKTSADLSWDRPTIAGYDPQDEGIYVIESGTRTSDGQNTEWNKYAEVPSSELTYPLANLEPGKDHHFRVLVRYSQRHNQTYRWGQRTADDALPSKVNFFTCVVPGPPATPNMKIEIKRNLLFEWEEPEDTGGGPLHYELSHAKAGTDDWKPVIVEEQISEPRYKLLTSTLDVGDHHFSVVGVNANGLKSGCSQPSIVYTKKCDVEIKDIKKKNNKIEDKSKKTPAHRRLQNKKYRNYLQSVHAIQIFCKGSLAFTDKVIRLYHDTLTVSYFQGKECLNHTVQRECNNKKAKALCDNCKNMKKTMAKKLRRDTQFTTGAVVMRMVRQDPWEMAKLFMTRQVQKTEKKQNQTQQGQAQQPYQSQTAVSNTRKDLQPDDFDASSLLQLMNNFKDFHGKPDKSAKRASHDKYRAVLFARNDLMHMEIKNGLKIKTSLREEYLQRIEELVLFIETKVEPDPTVFSSDDIRKEMKRLEQASIDELVAVEVDVIQGTITEYDAEIQDIENELEQSGGKDPERVEKMKERINDLTNYLKQYEDLWATFEDQMKQLGFDLRDVQSLMERLQSNPNLLDKLQDNTEVVQLKLSLAHFYIRSFSHVELLPRDSETTVPISDLPTEIDVMAEKRTLSSYEDIFTLSTDGKTVTKFLILGKEWIGKSTYIRRIAYDWAMLHNSTKATNMSSKDKQNPLSHFELVFCLNANRISPDADLLHAITMDLLPPNSSQSEVIRHVLATSPERVLFLIDGFSGKGLQFMREVKDLNAALMCTLRPQHLQAMESVLNSSRYLTLQISRLSGLEDSHLMSAEDEMRIQKLPEKLQSVAVSVRNICHNYTSLPNEKLLELVNETKSDIARLNLDELKQVMTGITSERYVGEDLYSMKHTYIARFHDSISESIKVKSGQRM